MLDRSNPDRANNQGLVGKIPRIFPRVGSLVHWAHLMRSPVNFETRAGAMGLEFPADFLPPRGQFIQVKGSSGDSQILINLPVSLIDELPEPYCAALRQMLGRVDGYTQSNSTNPRVASLMLSRVDVYTTLTSTNARLAALTLEHIVGPALQAGSHAFEAETVRLVIASQVTGDALLLDMGDQKASCMIYVDADPEVAKVLNGRIDHRAMISRKFGAEIALPVSICSKAFWIDRVDLAAWNSGDVIDLGVHGDPIAILWPRAAVCKRKDAGWVMDGQLRRIVTPTSSGENTVGTPVSNSELTVLVTFEINRRPMTFADLDAIGRGSVFELDDLDNAEVTVRANDTIVAMGRMVETDSRLAVQILHIAEDV